MVESAPQGIKIALIGATGAIGKEVLKTLVVQEGVSEITVLARREFGIEVRESDKEK
jgi:uncharacterized protein YbjT (DUF2867 family)